MWKSFHLLLFCWTPCIFFQSFIFFYFMVMLFACFITFMLFILSCAAHGIHFIMGEVFEPLCTNDSIAALQLRDSEMMDAFLRIFHSINLNGWKHNMGIACATKAIRTKRKKKLSICSWNASLFWEATKKRRKKNYEIWNL